MIEHGAVEHAATLDRDQLSPHHLWQAGERGFDFEPSWAPDGSRIVFARQDYGGGSVQIFVVNADGTGPEQLTSGPEWNAQPSWEPVPVESGSPPPST